MDLLAQASDCASWAFQPRLGDATPAGLAMTALYVVTAIAMLAALWRGQAWRPGERLLWRLSTGLVILLTLNKQLDLQHSAYMTARCVVRASGSHAAVLPLQQAIGVVLLLLALGFAFWMYRICRAALASNPKLRLGLILLLAYLCLQIARFDALAGSLGETVQTLRLHRILEGVALAFLSWAAFKRQAQGNPV